MQAPMGMGAAVDILRRDGEAERCKVGRMRDSFVEMILQFVPAAIVNGPPAPQRHSGNSNVGIEGLHARDVLATLQPGVAAPKGVTCTSGIS